MIKPGNLAEVEEDSILYEKLPHVVGESPFVRLQGVDRIVTIISTHLGPVRQDDPVWSYVLWSNNGLITLGWVITTALIPKGFINA